MNDMAASSVPQSRASYQLGLTLFGNDLGSRLYCHQGEICVQRQQETLQADKDGFEAVVVARDFDDKAVSDH
jgi:hypothetical protein